MLRQDITLLLRRELREGAIATKRIPDSPWPVRVGDGPPRPREEGVIEIRLVAERIRAPEHAVVWLERQPRHRTGPQTRPDLRNEHRRILVEREHRDPV